MGQATIYIGNPEISIVNASHMGADGLWRHSAVPITTSFTTTYPTDVYNWPYESNNSTAPKSGFPEYKLSTYEYPTSITFSGGPIFPAANTQSFTLYLTSKEDPVNDRVMIYNGTLTNGEGGTTLQTYEIKNASLSGGMSHLRGKTLALRKEYGGHQNYNSPTGVYFYDIVAANVTTASGYWVTLTCNEGGTIKFTDNTTSKLFNPSGSYGLNVTPADGYYLESITTTNGTLTDNNGTYWKYTAGSSDATVTATFKKYVTVTWANYDGNNGKKTQQFKQGVTPTYSGTPTKAKTAQYTYTFSKWTPTPAAVYANMTYTAEFSSTVNSYTITWNPNNGVASKTTTVAYGNTPTSPFSSLSKTSTVQYDYQFSGWSPSIASVTGNATYTAQYSSTVRKYNITWVLDNGSANVVESVAYGTTPSRNGPTKATDSKYSYIFNRWTPTPTAVTGAATYTALYNLTPRSYTVTTAVATDDPSNVTGSGETLGTVTLPQTNSTYSYGSRVQIAQTPASGFNFARWVISPSGTVADDYFLMPDTNVILTAYYTKNHALTWNSGAILNYKQNDYSITLTLNGSAVDTHGYAVEYYLYVNGVQKARFINNQVTLQIHDSDIGVKYTYMAVAKNLTSIDDPLTANGPSITEDAKQVHKTVSYYTNNTWVECIPYYYTNNEWKEVEPRYYTNNQWVVLSFDGSLKR